MFTAPSNVINRQPDFLYGFDKGSPVLVPAGMALGGPQIADGDPTTLAGSELTLTRGLAAKYGTAGEPDFAISRAWAALPLPADYIGTAYVTDVGLRGSLWRSDGTTWGLVGGSCVLARGHTDITVTANDTNDIDLVTIPIPAGLIGANGSLVVNHMWTMTNGVNDKTMRVKLGGTAFFANVQTAVASYFPPETVIFNRNSQSSQIAFPAANGRTNVGTGSAMTTGTIDTSAATTLVISGQKEVGTETLTLNAYNVTLIRP